MLIVGDALATEPLLTPAEETELAGRIEAGVLAREARLSGKGCDDATEGELTVLEERGERARQRFIRANLRLVAKLARQSARRSQLSEADLFQEGCLGLISAIERFDCRLGYKFSTYASFWVRAYLGAASASQLGALNLPPSRAGQLRVARGVEGELTQLLGRSPSSAELAAALGRSQRWATELMASQAPQALDGLDVDRDPALAEPDPFAAVESRDHPGAELLGRLEGLERDVLALRCGFDDGRAHSYAETARRLELSVSRVRRVEGRALATLRTCCPPSARAYL